MFNFLNPCRILFNPNWFEVPIEFKMFLLALKIKQSFILFIYFSHYKICKILGCDKPLPIPDWKWDKIGMDFITGLPRTRSGYDSIWVVVDRLTKVAHFIPVKTIYTSAKLAKIYMSRIVCLHGVPKSIVSDRELNSLPIFGDSYMSHWER